MLPASYQIRRKILTLLDAKFHFRSLDGTILAFSRQKAFKLKEDIRIYADEEMSREILGIKARNIIDFSAAYDVIDPLSGRIYGTWRRKGLMSAFLRDSWELLIDETPAAILQEDSLGLALLRRNLCSLIPQTYHLKDPKGMPVAEYRQNFNPFVYKLNVTNHIAHDERMSMLVAAGGLLMAAIEGKQRN